MKYIRTKDKVFEVVDYEQLDDKTKECLKQKRFVGLCDYINDEIFVKVHKQMPKPLSQYQPIKMFDIIKQADTIKELIDGFVVRNKANNRRFVYSKEGFQKRIKRNKTHIYERDNYEDRLKYFLEHNDVHGAIWTDKGLIYVAKMNEKGELELL